MRFGPIRYSKFHLKRRGANIVNTNTNSKHVMLNLGCGVKTSNRCVNIDWSLYIRLANSMLLRLILNPFIGATRRRKLDTISGNIMNWNLKKGIPYEDNSVDAVYHSHLLEHLDRDIAPLFLMEILRALKPGGVLRIVVPDLSYLVAQYVKSLEKNDARNHEKSIAEIFEQCVRREAHGTSTQPAIRRFIENLLLGDARKRGETHQWMYDQVSLGTLLDEVGYHDIQVLTYDKSDISKDWLSFGLDINDDNQEYKLGSLYIEGRKPT